MSGLTEFIQALTGLLELLSKNPEYQWLVWATLAIVAIFPLKWFVAYAIDKYREISIWNKLEKALNENTKLLERVRKALSQG